jgi:hypothetical protein
VYLDAHTLVDPDDPEHSMDTETIAELLLA